MNPVELVGRRMQEALIVAVLTTGITAIGGALDNTVTADSATTESLFVLMQGYPLLFTLIGIAVAFIAAGPLGVLGTILEGWGASILINQGSTSGFSLIIIGAILVVIGRFIPWGEFYAGFLDGGGGM